MDKNDNLIYSEIKTTKDECDKELSNSVYNRESDKTPKWIWTILEFIF